MKRWTTIIVVALVLSPVVRAQPVYFADANLKARVESKLGVVNPTPTDMLGLTMLGAQSRSISDLTGLQFATNLMCLFIEGNRRTAAFALAFRFLRHGLHCMRGIAQDTSLEAVFRRFLVPNRLFTENRLID